MMTRFATLWHKLRSFLQDDGHLPLEYEVLTPAEIADVVRSTNADERPLRFVWGYLYPGHYGHEIGEVNEEEASALVNSFEKKPVLIETVTAEEMPKTEPVHNETCLICRRKQVAR